jgi:hypothetical protein
MAAANSALEMAQMTLNKLVLMLSWYRKRSGCSGFALMTRYSLLR